MRKAEEHRMGSVTRMEPRQEQNTASSDDVEELVPRPPSPEPPGPVPPSRRTPAPCGRAAIVLDVASGGLEHSLTVPGVPERTGEVRRRLAELALLPGERTDVLQGLVSELFTNAVRHTRSGLPGGTVVVALYRLRGCVRVRVTDQGARDGSGKPRVREQDLEREGGFGLRLVALQADRWGAVCEDGRTTVWFELDRG
ncbi:Anti-sigma regulatory factor (Ser/Thr protein kinase) [Nocardiopsis flavescens]|uniref:Anti-sigma regulatory factor (Ser/Thr protein kinase) n=2 Tax=Nocardiopsis flavescens TaxID=758803 RepID=A0A1M6VT28_9ACTN|nr:Anti-sigma regulatory factor (Ser/Thr protein kinase) [Nocardiopsis flavescens]